MIQDFLHKTLWGITEKHPSRTREISRKGKKYLRRFYLTPRRLDSDGNETSKYKGFGVYLHYFYRGDEDKELHNHPWNFALSFILVGGYNELRRFGNEKDGYYVVKTKVKPFTFNLIKPNTFHKIIKNDRKKHVWTLFITGKRIQDWGFWNKITNAFTPHKDFVKQTEQGYKKKD